ncbi:MAG: hypothetical protein LBL07_05440 [Tannerella sp.]|jgi:hypothetical protein|nr:hypothetical protein [Tannerella sp.]
MEKSDYFAEFRLVFRQIVKQQEADSTLQLLHFRFIAPVKEVAQTAKLARMAIDLGPEDENENFAVIPFLMFVIKMLSTSRSTRCNWTLPRLNGNTNRPF